MKLIFLDFDDVLNDKHTPLMTHPAMPDRQVLGIDPFKVELVNTIMSRAGGPDEVKFVASTSWRRWYSNQQLQALLAEKGFGGEIIDQTPLTMSFLAREGEISLWFDLNTDRSHMEVPLPEYFLVLDNEPMRGHWKRHAVKTTQDLGLNRAHVAMGVNILNTRPAKETYAKIRAHYAREEAQMDRYLERIGQRARARAAAEVTAPSPAEPAGKASGPAW